MDQCNYPPRDPTPKECIYMCIWGTYIHRNGSTLIMSLYSSYKSRLFWSLSTYNIKATDGILFTVQLSPSRSFERVVSISQYFWVISRECCTPGLESSGNERIPNDYTNQSKSCSFPSLSWDTEAISDGSVESHSAWFWPQQDWTGR